MTDDPDRLLRVSREHLDRFAEELARPANYCKGVPEPLQASLVARGVAVAEALRTATTLDAVGCAFDLLEAFIADTCSTTGRKGVLRGPLISHLCECSNYLRGTYVNWYIDRNLPSPPGLRPTHSGATPYPWSPR